MAKFKITFILPTDEKILSRWCFSSPLVQDDLPSAKSMRPPSSCPGLFSWTSRCDRSICFRSLFTDRFVFSYPADSYGLLFDPFAILALQLVIFPGKCFGIFLDHEIPEVIFLARAIPSPWQASPSNTIPSSSAILLEFYSRTGRPVTFFLASFLEACTIRPEFQVSAPAFPLNFPPPQTPHLLFQVKAYLASFHRVVSNETHF